MKSLVIAAVGWALLAGSAHAASPHRCADDAKTRAKALLTLHFNDGASGGTVENLAIDDAVAALAPAKPLTGSGKFDVLEVWGNIYKARYRMRLIYAQIADSCVLMGQEILEDSNPY